MAVAQVSLFTKKKKKQFQSLRTEEKANHRSSCWSMFGGWLLQFSANTTQDQWGAMGGIAEDETMTLFISFHSKQMGCDAPLGKLTTCICLTNFMLGSSSPKFIYRNNKNGSYNGKEPNKIPLLGWKKPAARHRVCGSIRNLLFPAFLPHPYRWYVRWGRNGELGLAV